MNIYLIPMEKFVKINNLQEVTNPIYFERGNIPTSDGLFSTEIFGVDVNSRKKTFAYIDLKAHFLQPQVYKLLKRLDRRFVNIVSGLGKYSIDAKGNIVEDENGSSGLEWLYKNWSKINFTKNESYLRNEKVDLLVVHPRDTIFCTKWVVIPPFTRDVNLQTLGGGKQLKIHVVNDLYARLLRNSRIITSENEFDFTLSRVRFQTQQTLEEIYNHFKSKLDTKHGLIRKSLMGRSTANATISVITNPRMSEAKKVDENYISLDHVGIPISQATKQFFPFVLYEMKKFLSNNLELAGNKIPTVKSDGTEVGHLEFVEPMLYFNEEFLKKRVELFNNTPTSRFELIEVPVKDETGKEMMINIGFGGKSVYGQSTIAQRPMTWMDLIYISVVEATRDKYVHITRHPVLDKFGSFVAKPIILTTMETSEVVVNGTVYDRYPVIKFDLPDHVMATYFIDNISFSNAYADGLGADYDGDTIIAKGIWSQQGNATAEKINNSKESLIAVNGKNVRLLGKEVTQCLYNLTK